MEVGDQPVDPAKAIAGCDEDRGVAFERTDHAVFAGGTFDQPQAGRADRDDAPAAGPHRVQPVGGRGVDPAPFGVHFVIVRILGLDRQERPRADVQRQRRMFDPCPVQLRHQRGRKVQRRRRGCDRALLGGEHRLVILGILRIGRAACRDIGR